MVCVYIGWRGNRAAYFNTSYSILSGIVFYCLEVLQNVEWFIAPFGC